MVPECHRWRGRQILLVLIVPVAITVLILLAISTAVRVESLQIAIMIVVRAASCLARVSRDLAYCGRRPVLEWCFRAEWDRTSISWPLEHFKTCSKTSVPIFFSSVSRTGFKSWKWSHRALSFNSRKKYWAGASDSRQHSKFQ